jgi:starvation-inducible DNA-binding protein
MTTPTMLQRPISLSNPMAESLQDVLANTYGLYLATHNYHWNVEGQKFLPLHMYFETQYNELFLAVDTIAERIRALNMYALPFEGDNLTQITKLTSNALNKELESDERAMRMVQNLIALNESTVKSCQISKKIAQNLRDDETENLLIERITVHQKALWMLSSIAKD